MAGTGFAGARSCPTGYGAASDSKLTISLRPVHSVQTAQSVPKAQEMQYDHKAYVLVTPARNEKDFIELTIKSVVAQTVKPLLWVIVSDRSVDGTDEIVCRYAQKYPFIHLVRNDKPSERNTAAKVHAINLGH